MNITECNGYKKLLAAVEHDESTEKNPGTRYRNKLKWIVERASHYSDS